MIASLLRPKKGRHRRSSLVSPFHTKRISREHGLEHDEEEEEHGDSEDEDEHEGQEDAPLLPIFSSALLDSLPVYSLTLTIRFLIVQRCETTLSWDQLRSPQISQFLVKPIQQQIQNQHFSKATVFALIANCLQFGKEGQTNPGNVGVSGTRALVAELLAIRLLKEFSTRDLIDVLAYDFDPLQGQSPATAGSGSPRIIRAARISTIEIAIRARAKKFISHPLVVQQLEAIWAGTIVFYSVADDLHRTPRKGQLRAQREYGATAPANSVVRHSVDGHYDRKTVTLYDPHEASLFKLSRLRVPRYRMILSTGSYAIMLGLFSFVLMQRSQDITLLEIVFWFWGAGFMLDEIVGFSEQGFGLYIMSVWNAFDIGILLLFFVYYIMRLYVLLIPLQHKRHTANLGYDVLACTAVLLFPRLFSVLDHYQYFSQLLIAFRLMALDLVAILILIVIACSGFFVAFATSFGDEGFKGAGEVVYALFQLVMGFTPVVWAAWDYYNYLGRALMTLFLFICHFLIVTILITVLTNSFMAVVRNANEEHQFLFAVNTLSSVKSDALFSYIPPSNLIGWMLSPLRHIVPFKQFIKINRYVIKITHFPFLLAIFAFERLILVRYAYLPTDLVEQPMHRHDKKIPAFSFGNAENVFSPGARLREPSVATFQKDRALEEVFRKPFRDTTLRTSQAEQQQQRSSNVVDLWMSGMGREGGASSPQEQPQSVLDQLETVRPSMRRAYTSRQRVTRRRDFSFRSAASEPDDAVSHTIQRRPRPIEEESDVEEVGVDDLPHQTDADGDDELLTNDEEDRVTPSKVTAQTSPNEGHDQAQENQPIDYFQPSNTRIPIELRSSAPTQLGPPSPAPVRPLVPRAPSHMRNASSATIRYSPHPTLQRHSSSSASPRHRPSTPRRTLKPPTPASPFGFPRQRSPPQRSPPTVQRTKSRPIMPGRDQTKSTPNLDAFLSRSRQRNPSFSARALDLASDIGDNRNVAANDFAFVPGSFATQLAYVNEMQQNQRQRRSVEDETGMVSRIMLSRMNTLEEGFKDILKEVKEWRREGGGGGGASTRHNSAGEDVGSKTSSKRTVKRAGGPQRSALGSKRTDMRPAAQQDNDENTPAQGGQSE